jgi:hypothetical protein
MTALENELNEAALNKCIEQRDKAEARVESAIRDERETCAVMLEKMAEDGEATVSIMAELGYPTSKSVIAEALRLGAAVIRARNGKTATTGE